MFTRAVDFVRTNIPDSIKEKATPYVEKATPYYNQAQDKASEYYTQAQTMRTKFVDDATTRVSSLKESSTTYVNGAAERLDDLLIDNGANKISSQCFGREIVHFHFKEALAKLAAERRQEEAQNQQQENKEEQEKQEEENKEQSSSSSSSIKDRAASSIANLFNNMKSSSSAIVSSVTEKINTNKARLAEKIHIPSNIQESRQLAVHSVAGAFTFAISSGKFALERGSKYVDADKINNMIPANVTSLAQKTLSTATPYVEKTVGLSRELDSKYLNGFAFAFVNDVQTEMSPTTNTAPEQQEQHATSTTMSSSVPPSATAETQEDQEQQQEPEGEQLADQDNF